jgi:hypothetical protein
VSGSAGTGIQRFINDSPDELLVRPAGDARLACHAGVDGEVGIGVYVDDVWYAIVGETHIDAGVTASIH